MEGQTRPAPHGGGCLTRNVALGTQLDPQDDASAEDCPLPAVMLGVFAITIFLSATLLFLVELMVGKMMLPLLGGTPAVWNTCMVFFQSLLLVGYAYAHLLATRLGARAQDAAALADPVNALEAEEDREGIWRTHANTALAGAYQQLWARIDLLALLAAPGWQVVETWREQQEAELRAAGAPRAMTPADLRRFIQHYERLTRWILQEMPARADLVVRLDADRTIASSSMNI